MSGKSSDSPIKILTYRDPQELSLSAGEYLADAIHQTQLERESVSLMLSGGSTPKGVYSHLASREQASKIDWSRLQIYWSDERCVSPDHPDSNYHLAYQTLLQHVPLEAKNIHRIRGEIDPLSAAHGYEAELASLGSESQKPPSIDFLLLGMGEDGHIASLFPGSSALDETKRWVLAVHHASPPPPLGWRITVTFPLIHSAMRVIILVAGYKKAACVHQALFAGLTEPALPAQRLRQAKGEVIWIMDDAAAGGG